jgi:hypothetical protein
MTGAWIIKFTGNGFFVGHLLFSSFDHYSEENTHFLGKNNEKKYKINVEGKNSCIMQFRMKYGHRATYTRKVKNI